MHRLNHPDRYALAILMLGPMAAALAPSAATAQALPSFDCAKSPTLVEKMICADATLAALDVEMEQLFTLARDGAGAARNDVIKAQDGWLAQRNDCTSSTDSKRCLAEAYVERISVLRETYPAARRAKGISLGPFKASCEGLGSPLTVTFVNSSPSYAYVSATKESVVLKQALSGSGARYEAQYPKGQTRLWNKGEGALIALPGGKDMNCTLKSAG
ncbi:MAG: MliC family protein [Xanthobacteraceae bacterium]|nr:MliC family protein [Xanthobacteraceae bacterium]